MHAGSVATGKRFPVWFRVLAIGDDFGNLLCSSDKRAQAAMNPPWLWNSWAESHQVQNRDTSALQNHEKKTTVNLKSGLQRNSSLVDMCWIGICPDLTLVVKIPQVKKQNKSYPVAFSPLLVRFSTWWQLFILVIFNMLLIFGLLF